MSYRKTVYALLLFFLTPSPLFAYIDPGTGSMLLYAIVGAGVALLYTLKGIFFSLLQILRGRRPANIRASLDTDFIFHSEGKHYDHLFLPLLKEMCGAEMKEGSVITYITQYDRDELPALPENVRHLSIRSGATGFATLNRVKGKMLVTTTPQLDVMSFKRSPHVKHYCHLNHATADASFYKPYAFDHFDSVLCPGEFMVKSIRILEKKRNLPQKKLFPTGVVYFDQLIGRVSEKNEKSEKPCLLIAPSWGANGLFSRWGADFLNDLSDDYFVIVRPHPQIRISQEMLYTELTRLCRRNRFAFDEAPSGKKSMDKSDLMISDFSGIIFEYCFVYHKPMILADTDLEYKGFEGFFLDKPLWDEKIRHKIGRVIKSDEIFRLKDIVREELGKKPLRIAELRDQNVANFGNAVPETARRLRELWKEIT